MPQEDVLFLTRPQTKDSTWCWATNLQSFCSCMWSSCKKKKKWKRTYPAFQTNKGTLTFDLETAKGNTPHPLPKCPFRSSWAKANFSHKSYTGQAMPSPKPWWNSFRHSTHANMRSPENSPFLKIVLGIGHCFSLTGQQGELAWRKKYLAKQGIWFFTKMVIKCLCEEFVKIKFSQTSKSVLFTRQLTHKLLLKPLFTFVQICLLTMCMMCNILHSTFNLCQLDLNYWLKLFVLNKYLLVKWIVCLSLYFLLSYKLWVTSNAPVRKKCANLFLSLRPLDLILCHE